MCAPYLASYIAQLSNYIYRCIKLGEHRQVLADLLWVRASKMVNNENSDEQEAMHRYFSEIKTLEDIAIRAKQILKKECIP